MVFVVYPKKREVSTSYDSLGGDVYDLRYEDEQNDKYDVIFENIPSNSDDLTLDLGCGTGLLIRRLKTYTIGLDISTVLIKKAKSRTKGSVNVQYVLADAENVPFRQCMFNVIFAITIIQNAPNPEKLIYEMIFSSRRSGIIIITALKKAYTKERFLNLLASSGLYFLNIVDDEKSKDIIVVTKRIHS
jgi:ubiquinone/menaquinone biosynthesis C-methylase UbiE